MQKYISFIKKSKVTSSCKAIMQEGIALYV